MFALISLVLIGWLFGINAAIIVVLGFCAFFFIAYICETITGFERKLQAKGLWPKSH